MYMLPMRLSEYQAVGLSIESLWHHKNWIFLLYVFASNEDNESFDLNTPISVAIANVVYWYWFKNQSTVLILIFKSKSVNDDVSVKDVK